MHADNHKIQHRIDELERTLSHLRHSVARDQLQRWDIREELLDIITHIERGYRHQVLDSSIPTGLNEYDRMTQGLHPGELTLIAGLPGSGKTALISTLLQNIALRSRQPALVFSLHQPARQILLRAFCAQAQIPIAQVRSAALDSDSQFQSLRDAARRLSDSPIFIDDSPDLTIWDLVDITRQYCEDEDVQVVFIDYLQLLRLNTSEPPGKRKEEMNEITGFLKQLARDLNIPIVASTQLGHSVQLRSEPTPTMAHLREFGDIENIADVVTLLSRSPNCPTGEIEVNIAKQSLGPTGTFRLRFHPELATLENLATV